MRYQGGPNAGHSVMPGDSLLVLHQLPCGVLRSGCVGIDGPGMVLSPSDLLEEIESLKKAGEFRGSLYISERAHVILPLHKAQDRWEEALRGDRATGTTLRGIGPAYMDRAGRWGLRIADLARPELVREKLDFLYRAKSHLTEGTSDLPGRDELAAELSRLGETLRPYVRATEPILWQAIREGKNVLLEGAQSALLDVDYGTYPFVTSSHPTAAGALVGSGIPPQELDEVMGISKAYSTRVGGGPFPTELKGPEGDRLRERGGERGATTGRSRRVGWLDLVLLRYAARLNGFTSLAVTKVDILGGEPEVPVCVSYTLPDGKSVEDYPPVLSDDLEKVSPVYETLPGWEEFTPRLKTRLAKEGWRALPRELKAYLGFVSDAVGVPVTLVSYGPRRSETVEIPLGALAGKRTIAEWQAR